MRNRSEPGQVVQASFEPGRIAVTRRVNGCYCAPARTERHWRIEKIVRPKKDAERRDKRGVRFGKDT
jgi:hypothetical protein